MLFFVIPTRTLYDYAAVQLSHLQRKHRALPICSIDWDDIKQDIMIRVFDKQHLIDDVRGFKGYVCTIIRNAFQNEMRDRCASEVQPDNRRAKLNVMYPCTIRTKVRQYGVAGDETIYEPDCAAPTDNITPEAREQVAQIISLLPPETRAILSTYEKAASWDEAGRALKLNSQVARNRYRKTVALIRAQLASL